nr:hypothetical protein [Alphaproteobacteria bacterium]
AISNNISGVANAGDLTGTADARFYGTDAKEFGGTFALTHKTDNSYYYGAFGANRDGIATGYNALTIFDSHSVITPQTVTIADDADTVAYVSLSAASADTDNAVAKTFILNGLTVHGTITNIHQRVPSQQWETVDYSQTATGATIDDSALSLAFATDGTLSGVTAHLNDGTNDVSYIAGTADNTPTTTSFGATISSGAPSDATSTSINVERGSDFFGFDSNYMVYLNWNIQETFLDVNSLNETTYTIDGMMLAGMRLDGDNIRKNGTAEFSGKGRGIYGDKDFNYATIFDVTANVNFGAANVKFESSNTCKAIDCGDNPVNTLDFTSSSLSFIALDNYNISGGLFADDNKLVGTIYARFYGTQGWELGGTFGLEDNARFYYGAFGTQRLTGIVTPLTFDNTPIAVTLPNDVTLNADSSLSISSVVDAAIADETLDDTPHTLVMGAIAASNDDSTHYQRSQNMAWAAYNDAADSQRTISTSRLTGAAASLSFDETTGYISGVTAYADATYTATADAPASATSFTATNADGVTINLERGTNLFGFDSDYMAYLSWQSQSDDMFENNNATLNEIIYDRDGIMLAGIETIDVNRISGITSFTGKGRGFYDDDSLFKDDASYATIFDVTAAIDFANKNIALTIDETCKASDCSVKTTHLDLGTIALAFPTADDKYVVANNITGVANADNGNLTGNIDARFYSTEAREFGGTFALAGTINGSNNYYHGAFGLVRSTYIISTNHGTTTHADTPTNINQHGLTGFNDEARKGNGSGTSDNALQIATSVQITKGNADGFASDTIITEKITGAVIEFDYDSDGDFFVDQNQLTTLYVADKEYYIYSGSGSEGAITYDSGGVDGADKLSLRRDRFGFTDNASYMARIAWEVTADKNYGYGIVGYETDGTNLTNIGNENANFTNTPFTGKGRGRYSDINNTDANIYFDISADIDFANRTATLKSSETCTHLLAAKCAEAEFQRHDLNFTGELKYDANKNNVFGVLTTAGFTDINNSDNNIASLAGTADARFYGPNANEFGGTFALQNNIAAYAGWFGVARENIIYQQVANTPTKKANEGGIIPNNITINHNNLTILDEGGDRDNRIGKTNNLFNAYAVQLINDTQNQTITTERIDGALFEISFVAEDGGQIDLDYIDDNDIVIVENSPILYLGDKKYDLSSIFTNDGNGLNDTFNDGNKIERAIFDEVNDVAFTTPSIVNINNSWNQHGFTARYVYLLEWTINDSTVDTYGVTLFGIETAGGDIPTTGTNVQFVGRGYGKYQDSSNSSDNARYFFDIEADINFATRKIDLEAINTCTVRSDNCGDDNEYINGIYKIENGERRSHLDFKGTLSYGVDTDMNPVNDINGNDFTTKGDDLVYNDDATELTGDAHARFYGTGTNGAKEFGGTFRMQNDDTAYIGFFSACDGVKNATNYSSNCNYID